MYLVRSFRLIRRPACMMLLAAAALASCAWPTEDEGEESKAEHPIVYHTIQVDGFSISYREAGPKDAPTLLLLHGLPSSSRMFEPLLARLSDRCYLVAPDYPGFGHNDWPDTKKSSYTFDHIAQVMNEFTEALGLRMRQDHAKTHRRNPACTVCTAKAGSRL